LIVAPGRANVDHNSLLSEFVKRTGVTVATWRSRLRDWHGGPVLAAWPTREKLGEIADDPRTAALCVVPWVKGEVDAWAAAESPELLGRAAVNSSAALDPVVVEGLKTLTAMGEHGNNLAGSLDHRDAVAVLRTLKDGGYRLSPDLIYSWAIGNEWSARGAERLRELAAKFEAGEAASTQGRLPVALGRP
jgi:hypothetical protein